jgi:hypothetical protein
MAPSSTVRYQCFAFIGLRTQQRTEKVFEHLVQRCLPMLHEHFVETDIQLSVASLPWFMSLFISTMPLIFVRLHHRRRR